MKTVLAVLLLACGMHAAETNSPTPLGYVKEGVYWAHTPDFTNVIELNEGRIRGRYTSRLFSGGNQGSRSERTELFRNWEGDYKTNGSKVTLIGQTQGGQTQGRIASQTNANEFTCVELKGQVLLMSPGALKFWDQNKSISPSGVWKATDRKPEDIIAGK